VSVGGREREDDPCIRPPHVKECHIHLQQRRKGHGKQTLHHRKSMAFLPRQGSEGGSPLLLAPSCASRSTQKKPALDAIHSDALEQYSTLCNLLSPSYGPSISYKRNERSSSYLGVPHGGHDTLQALPASLSCSCIVHYSYYPISILIRTSCMEWLLPWCAPWWTSDTPEALPLCLLARGHTRGPEGREEERKRSHPFVRIHYGPALGEPACRAGGGTSLGRRSGFHPFQASCGLIEAVDVAPEGAG